MTNIIRVSATHARNNFFEILNQVAAGVSVAVEKDNKEVAVIVPSHEGEFDWLSFKRALIGTRGLLGVSFTSPLRGKKAGMWMKRVKSL